MVHCTGEEWLKDCKKKPIFFAGALFQGEVCCFVVEKRNNADLSTHQNKFGTKNLMKLQVARHLAANLCDLQ